MNADSAIGGSRGSTKLTGEELDGPDELEVRRAKTVLFLVAFTFLSLVVIVVLVFFQPRDQVIITRYENGYPCTETHHVMGTLGKPVRHGRHKAWHPNGLLSERGRYEHGLRVGEWEFWDAEGAIDSSRTGTYLRDELETKP